MLKKVSFIISIKNNLFKKHIKIKKPSFTSKTCPTNWKKKGQDDKLETKSERLSIKTTPYITLTCG